MPLQAEKVATLLHLTGPVRLMFLAAVESVAVSPDPTPPANGGGTVLTVDDIAQAAAATAT